MDYRIYKMNRSELILYGLEAMALTAAVSVCFYNSIWGCLAMPLVFAAVLRERKKALCEKRRKALKLQFKDAVQGIAAALAAGYSAENALGEAHKDLSVMYSADTDMVQELAAMLRRLDANQTIEAVLQDFADRSGMEEAETFAEIFAAAKRGGGDLIGIMNDTARTISETVETERQMAAAVASRQYEQNIMNWIPFVMIVYLRLGCPGFLDPLYQNAAGACIMTVCLGVYAGAWYLGRQLLRIEV